jgi:signal transduction histidine kinase
LDAARSGTSTPARGWGCRPTGDLRIDYTGISLVAPQNVAFRFKLDGIAPAHYQTNAFRALSLLLFAGGLWGGWPLRLRHLEMTLGARAAERTRVARDLHDTLLQDSQGLLLRFSSALKLLARPARRRPAKAHPRATPYRACDHRTSRETIWSGR